MGISETCFGIKLDREVKREELKDRLATCIDKSNGFSVQ